jgi:acyl-CoA thioesterase-1
MLPVLLFAAEGRKPTRVNSPMLERIEARVRDEPGLPRVLILGDSVSIGYTDLVRKRLAGVAVVRRPPTNCGSTHTGLENIDFWLGEKRWELIHFNWGLHDLRYGNPSKQPRTSVEGLVQNVTPADYEKNLRQLVARLKAVSDAQIFATTTPIPATQKQSEPRLQEDVAKYNAIARRVMAEEGVAVDDLNAVVKGREAELMPPEDIHFTKAGYGVLADAVAASIKAALSGGENVPATATTTTPTTPLEIPNSKSKIPKKFQISNSKNPAGGTGTADTAAGAGETVAAGGRAAARPDAETEEFILAAGETDAGAAAAATGTAGGGDGGEALPPPATAAVSEGARLDVSQQPSSLAGAAGVCFERKLQVLPLSRERWKCSRSGISGPSTTGRSHAPSDSTLPLLMQTPQATKTGGSQRVNPSSGSAALNAHTVRNRGSPSTLIQRL